MSRRRLRIQSVALVATSHCVQSRATRISLILQPSEMVSKTKTSLVPMPPTLLQTHSSSSLGAFQRWRSFTCCSTSATKPGSQQPFNGLYYRVVDSASGYALENPEGIRGCNLGRNALIHPGGFADSSSGGSGSPVNRCVTSIALLAFMRHSFFGGLVSHLHSRSQAVASPRRG